MINKNVLLYCYGILTFQIINFPLFTRIFTQVVVQKYPVLLNRQNVHSALELKVLEFENRLLFLKITEKTG